jgi:hypothetical protein
MVDVFVSYSSTDRERVRPLVDRLVAEGWDVWWDRDIGTGAAWDAEIEKALDQARCVVVVWTASSVVSEWVRTEANEALEHDRLVPVMLDDVRVPLAFRRVQSRRLIGWPSSHDRFELEQMLADMRKLLQTAPKPRRQSILDGDRIERRQVTLLRAEFVQAAGHADGLDPEAMDDWAQALEARLHAEVQASGGLLNQFDTTGCSCAFGVSVASEDDEVSAAETAFRLAAAVRGEHGLDLRMGLASGMAVVAPGPTPGTVRLTGNLTANAATLAKQAGPGQLLVSAATQRHLAPYFATEEAGSTAFVVLERTSVRNRIDAASILGFSPLVGRQNELSTLETALEEVIGGQGRAVCLLGDAGMGKSRLAHEFRSRALDHEAVVVQVRCLAHGQTRAHGPFSDLLRDVLRLGDVSPAEIEEQAVQRLLALDPGLELYLPRLLHLLSVPSATHRLPDSLEGLALRRALGEALVATATLAARAQPLVLVFEDWHWADEASKETLQHLVEACAFHRLMLLVCVRPEAAPLWPPLTHCSQMVLRPLGRAEVAELVRTLARADEVSANLAALMHTRTDGVPLFVEELTRALLEQGQLSVASGVLVSPEDINSIDLPGSVEAVVRSRLDRLDGELLELLRVAAVIGRQFERQLLDDLFGGADAVADGLAAAVAQGLVQQTRVVPEPEYRFRHLLTQVVAYESLLLKQRRAIHRRVGEWLERRYAAQLDEHSEVLAHHFLHAGVEDKAIHYLMRAGERAAQSASNVAAIELLRVAVGMLEKQPASPSRDELLLEAYVALGNALILVQGYSAPEVVQVYDRARELGREVAAGPAHFASLWMLWRYYYNRALANEAGEFAAMMLNLASESADEGLLLAAHTALGVVDALQGWPLKAREALQSAIGYWRPQTERDLALRFALSPAVLAHAFMGLSQTRLGESTAGLAMFETAIEISRRIDHPASEVLVLAYKRAAMLLLDNLAGAAAANQAMLELATTHELRHWMAHARRNQGEDMILAGQLETGEQVYRQAAEALDAMGVAMVKDSQLMFLAMLEHYAGRIDDGLALLAQARELTDRGGMRHLETEIDRVSVRLLWARDPAAAWSLARRALDDANRRNARLSALRLAAEVATLLRKDGRADDALAVLEPAWSAIDAADRASQPLFVRVGALLENLQESVSVSAKV